MNTANQIYQRFYDAILNKNTDDAALDIRTNGALSPAHRLNIYIDAYRLRLLAALRADYPTTHYALGDNAFNQHARDFIECNPSQSFNLDHYGHAFADFLETRTDRFVYDLATLESAIAVVFYLPESTPLQPAFFQTLSPDAFGNLYLKPRTAGRLLSLKHTVSDYLNDYRAGAQPTAPMPNDSYLYIYRHHHEVQRATLTLAGYTLLTSLFAGQPLNSAIEQTARQFPDDINAHLQNWMGQWVQNGFFAE